MKWLAAVALLCLSGCPSSCQQRRTTVNTGGERLEVKVERAEIEQQKQTTAKKGHKVTKRLRPDGTPWEVVEEKDDTVTHLELDRELMEKAGAVAMEWHKNTDVTVTRPWWYWPAIGLVVLAVMCALAWWIARRFFGGR